MPFDFEDYQRKCNGMTTEQLNKEWDNYTRQITSGSTSTATSVLLSPLTGGVSLVGLGFSAPRIHNARKKRDIIEAGLQARGTTHHTHMKDVLVPMATVGACSGLTLGLGLTGVELLPSTGAEHSVTEYAVSYAAASGTVEYVKFKAKELSRRKDEKAPEPRLQTSHTWPLDSPDREKYGPQLRPTIQPYSLYGHSDDDELESQVLQTSRLHIQTQITQATPPLPQTTLASPISLSESFTTSGSDISPQTPSYASQIQNFRSQSLPNSTSLQPNPQSQTAFIAQDTLRQETFSMSQSAITDTELDHFVAVLSEEEQKMLLMRLEMEVRKAELHKASITAPATSQPQIPQFRVEMETRTTEIRQIASTTSQLQEETESQTTEIPEAAPITSQPQLHRTHHVHAAHGHRPHPRVHDSAQLSSGSIQFEPAAQSSVSPQQGLLSIDEQRPSLPPQSPSLPLRGDATQAPTQAPLALPSRSPSLPVDMGITQTSPISSQTQAKRSSQISRKPIPSQQQIPSNVLAPPPPPPQTLHTQFKDQRQDSGYYSTASPSSLPGSSDTLQSCAPPIPNLSREIPAHRDSSSSLSLTSPSSQPPPTYSSLAAPPPNYYTPPPGTPVPGAQKDYFGQAAGPKIPMYCPADYTASPEQKSPNILGMFGWQFSTTSAPPVGMGTKAGLATEPDYGPPPAIPAAWRSP